MTRYRDWFPLLLASALALVLLTAGFVLVFDPDAGRVATPASLALFGVGALVAMTLVIDRLVSDALPAVVVGLKLSGVCCFVGGVAWGVAGAFAGVPGT